MANPNPWDTSGTSNSLADAIRRQAASQSKAATATQDKKTGVIKDPLEQLMQQIQNINVAATPMDMLMQQATGSAGAQFDPMIEQLKAAMSSTTQRGEANQAEAKQMYGALAQDISAELPQVQATADQASKEAQTRYDQTQEQLSSQYNAQAQQQADLYKKLGIQAAGPEASQQASQDQAYFQNQSQTDEDAAMALLQQMKQGDVSYNQQSADNTKLAGANAAQDIGAQLEQYLQGAQGQMAGLESGKEGAIQSMLAQLQQQDAQRVQTGEKDQYNQLMDMFNLQLKMQQMADSNASKATQDQLFKGTNGPNGSANYLGQIYGGDTFTPNSIDELINKVMSSPEAVNGKYQNSDLKDQYGAPITQDTSPEKLSDMLRSLMQNPDPGTNFAAPDYSTFDINNAISALMARMGTLK